jgi:hypothetical protein
MSEVNIQAGTPQAGVAGAGAPQTGGQDGTGSSVPKGLERFADATGKVDYGKVAQSYLELEKKFTVTAQERATYQQALAVAQSRVGAGAPANGAEVETGRSEIEELADDPRRYVEGTAARTIATMAQPIVKSILAMAHPEVAEVSPGVYKDPQFVEGLRQFAATMPMSIQQSLLAGDYQNSDWVIKLYKSQLAGGASSGQAGGSDAQFTENAGGAGPARQGKIWTRAEIRQMMEREPAKYAEMEPEINKAYAERRVKA